MRISFHFEFHIHIDRENGLVAKTDTEPRVQQAPADNFCQLAEQEIEKLSSARSLSTIQNYRTALHSFCKYHAEMPQKTGLDGETMKGFERWLRDHAICPNTISCYLRSLRSLAVRLYGDEAKRWFSQAYTGYDKTDKRAIEPSDLSRLRDLSLKPGSFLCLVRDLFLFSFYALGMPLVDMAYLRKEQIAEGQIVYYRHKTGQRVCVPLEPCLSEIINRYQSEQRDFVFPLLRSNNAETNEKKYRELLCHYNRSLKSLAQMAGISHRLTSYVARHTWASIAYNANVDLPVISKALGHSNPQHTLIYIREINDLRLEEANRKILTELH